MNPQDQNHGGQQSPTYGSGAGTPQQQYDTLPPPPITPNLGHSGHNPYEFIVSPQAAGPKRGISGLLNGNSFFAKIGLLLGGFVLLLVIAGVIITQLTAGSNNAAELLSSVKTQQEIIRISGTSQFASQQQVKNAAMTAQISLTSDQQDLLSYMSSHGQKVAPKELALGKDAQSDQLLSNARSTNTYDSALLEVLLDDITVYQTELRAAFDQTKNEALRIKLQKYYTNASLISTQLKNAQSN